MLPNLGVVPSLVVVADDQDEKEAILTSSLTQKGVRECGAQVLTISQINRQARFGKNLDIIFLADMHGHLLANMPAVTYNSIKSLVKAARKLLWVTSHGTAASKMPPYHALKDGLLRTLRNEFRTKQIVSLSL
ncbi:hypothetical protein F5B17DRAFT_152382 [Nemania serpens]|nr:hypothetical protein F5B17DRAFT_152382 [Nemania serpens]